MFLAEPRRGLPRAAPRLAATCGGCVFAALAADLVRSGPLTRAEQRTVWRRTGLVAPWAMVTGLGDRPALAAMTGTATVIAVARHRVWFAAVSPLATVAAGSLARWRLSRAIGRERPPQAGWLVAVDGPSFPSRHATAATLGALALYRALPGVPMVGWLLTAPVAAVGISRVRLGVHWPSDVVAGIAFAACVSSFVDTTVSAMIGHRLHRNAKAQQ